MLLSFTVDNFKSFNKPGTLSMFKGNVLKKKNHLMKVDNNEILKGAVIFGSNAGGKSSFIDAIGYSKQIILKDMSDERANSLKNLYCRKYEENRLKPSLFEYMFEIDGKCYKYTLKVILNKKVIVYEHLSEYNLSSRQTTTIYERINDGEEKFDFESGGFFSPEDIVKLKEATTDLEGSQSSSLLSILTHKKKFSEDSRLYTLSAIKSWFKSKLHVNEIPQITKEQSLELAEMLPHLIEDFNGAEYQIDNDAPKRLVELSEKVLNNNKMTSFAYDGFCAEYIDGDITTYSMKTHHKSTDELFDFLEESDGTHEALRLLHLLSDSFEGHTFIYDEFGSKMHPLLAKQFIELFYSIQEENNMQLIIATHHITLMTQELYRTDEIWLVDKQNGESEIYSVHEFNTRPDTSISKNYLAGRYGALPFLNEM